MRLHATMKHGSVMACDAMRNASNDILTIWNADETVRKLITTEGRILNDDDGTVYNTT